MDTQQKKDFSSMLIIQRSNFNDGPERVIINHMTIYTQEHITYNLQYDETDN